MPMPPEDYNPDTPWPNYPMILKTSSSHKEGCERRWNLATKRFIGEKGHVTGVEVAEVEWSKGTDGSMVMKETGQTEIIKADLVLLSMGFVSPIHEGLLEQLKVDYDNRGNVAAITSAQSSVAKVFVAGDVTSGAGLVVHAIASGRNAAKAINQYFR